MAANWADSNCSRFAAVTASAHSSGFASAHRRYRSTSRRESGG
jgi:hypothetical protein